ncbi:PREDICTED: exodeoxyribonuclease [Polistes canadensis]|uniref:exodeoxyribonuclease n=1 Tax=Polistes canadensis TaxID=91411 RepID=UPI000718F0D4|nr:PREDICTED: exodeoxyribonuclease [Polistes canadensis]
MPPKKSKVSKTNVSKSKQLAKDKKSSKTVLKKNSDSSKESGESSTEETEESMKISEKSTKRNTKAKEKEVNKEVVKNSKETVKKPIVDSLKELTSKNKRKANGNEEPIAKKAKIDNKPALNKVDTNLNEIHFDCDKLNAEGMKYNLKISTWNVSGIRAVIKKNGMDYIIKENADIVALQETKCDTNKLPSEVKVPGYHHYYTDSKKAGYCGVALYTKEKPINVKYGLNNSKLDEEGRLITAEYPNFFLLNVYVPNAGAKLITMPKRLEWNEKFKLYVKELDKKKPVIICGDMNVAHQEIDLANPKTNTKNAGFTKEERDGMTDFLDQGFVDTFRMLYPDKVGAYTFWSYFANSRNKNIGWRLDYFLLSERIQNKVCDNIIRSSVYGSDHCPIVLYINL